MSIGLSVPAQAARGGNLPLLLAAVCASACGGDPYPGAQEFPSPDGQASPAGAVHGIVYGPEGAVAGARVTSDPKGYETVTGPDGAFAFERLPPGMYRVVASADPLPTRWSDPFPLEDGGLAEVEVLLSAEEPVDALLRVEVRGPNALAWEGALVTATPATGAPVEAVTDARGVAVIEGLGGQSVALEVRDAEGLMWPWSAEAVAVPALGAVRREATLSGRPPEGAYVTGSHLCAACHTDQGATHAGTAHATSVRAPDAALLALFDAGTQVDLGGPKAILSRPGGAPVVRLVTPGGDARDLPVGGLIGARGAVPFTEIGDQAWPLPIAWIPEQPDREGFPDAGPRVVAWEVERWFDAKGELALTGGHPEPTGSADASCFPCHATGWKAKARTDGSVDLDPTDEDAGWGRFTEAGVSCEACHGPGSRHASGSLANKPYTITNPGLLDPARADDVCAQCHGAVVAHGDGLPFAWDASTGAHFTPGERLDAYAARAPVTWPSGAAALPGQQADELAASAHGDGDGWKMRCVDCHAPHGSTKSASLRVEHRDNALCLSCHAALHFDDDPAAVKAHTGHPIYDPAGVFESGRCTGCHMPPTAARVSWGAWTGAGDVASHLFVPLTPQTTIDAFDAAGASTLPLGDFPPSACSDCHGYNTWLWEESLGSDFPGPKGDPTKRATHQALQAAFEEILP